MLGYSKFSPVLAESVSCIKCRWYALRRCRRACFLSSIGISGRTMIMGFPSRPLITNRLLRNRTSFGGEYKRIQRKKTHLARTSWDIAMYELLSAFEPVCSCEEICLYGYSCNQSCNSRSAMLNRGALPGPLIHQETREPLHEMQVFAAFGFPCTFPACLSPSKLISCFGSDPSRILYW